MQEQEKSIKLHEKGAISPDMALRLSRAFDTTPDLWLNLQINLYYIRMQSSTLQIKKTR